MASESATSNCRRGGKMNRSNLLLQSSIACLILASFPAHAVDNDRHPADPGWYEKGLAVCIERAEASSIQMSACIRQLWENTLYQLALQEVDKQWSNPGLNDQALLRRLIHSSNLWLKSYQRCSEKHSPCMEQECREAAAPIADEVVEKFKSLIDLRHILDDIRENTAMATPQKREKGKGIGSSSAAADPRERLDIHIKRLFGRDFAVMKDAQCLTKGLEHICQANSSGCKVIDLTARLQISEDPWHGPTLDVQCSLLQETTPGPDASGLRTIDTQLSCPLF